MRRPPICARRSAARSSRGTRPPASWALKKKVRKVPVDEQNHEAIERDLPQHEGPVVGEHLVERRLLRMRKFPDDRRSTERLGAGSRRVIPESGPHRLGEVPLRGKETVNVDRQRKLRQRPGRGAGDRTRTVEHVECRLVARAEQLFELPPGRALTGQPACVHTFEYARYPSGLQVSRPGSGENAAGSTRSSTVGSPRLRCALRETPSARFRLREWSK